MTGLRRTLGGLLALCSLIVAWPCAAAEGLVDLRATFPAIAPYTRPPSPPAVREFSIPGPGQLRVVVTLVPWYRSTVVTQWRSLVPVDGRDEMAWTGHIPGADRISSTSTPERWVDGADLTIVTTYRVPKARLRLEAGLFPPTVRHGDGSVQQLQSSMSMRIDWTPDGSPAANAGGNDAGRAGAVTGGAGVAGPVGGTGTGSGGASAGPTGTASATVDCEARDGGRTWPCRFRLVRVDAGGTLEGVLEWPSLGSVHRVRGSVKGNQVRFTEVEALTAGRAHLNVDYTMTIAGGRADGRYVDRGDGSGGQMTMAWPRVVTTAP